MLCITFLFPITIHYFGFFCTHCLGIFFPLFLDTTLFFFFCAHGLGRFFQRLFVSLSLKQDLRYYLPTFPRQIIILVFLYKVFRKILPWVICFSILKIESCALPSYFPLQYNILVFCTLFRQIFHTVICLLIIKPPAFPGSSLLILKTFTPLCLYLKGSKAGNTILILVCSQPLMEEMFSRIVYCKLKACSLARGQRFGQKPTNYLPQELDVPAAKQLSPSGMLIKSHIFFCSIITA